MTHRFGYKRSGQGVDITAESNQKDMQTGVQRGLDLKPSREKTPNSILDETTMFKACV